MLVPNFPLRFTPIYKERIWGGDLHHRVLGARVDPNLRIGESWEISDRPEAASRVADGPLAGTTLRELIEAHPQAILGPGGSAQQRFPLLIKFIGAGDKLSLQVHPPDDYAREHHPGELGKTEMWYVLEAEPWAELHIGFRSAQTETAVRDAILENRFEPLVNAVPVKPGEAFFLPAGRVHGIGGGILLAEVQENSDVTYRVYDYGRTDEHGRPRALHVEPALRVMNFQDTGDGRVQAPPRTEAFGSRRLLAEDVHFHSEVVTYARPQAGPERSGFQVLITTDGEGDLHYPGGEDHLTRGAVRLLPAGFKNWSLTPGAQGVGILYAWK